MEQYKQSIKNNAQQLIDLGILPQANELIIQYQQMVPDDIDAYSMQAVIAILEGRLADGEHIIRQGMKIDQHNFDLVYNLAYIYEGQEKKQEAYELYLQLSNYENIGEYHDLVIEALQRLQEFAVVKHVVDPKKKIVFFVKQGMDSFLCDIIKGLSDDYETKKIIVTHMNQINQEMQWADICWFEWCDELIIYASNLDIGKKKTIICRLHSYEAFIDYPSKVNWPSVDKVIFVAKHIRDVVLENAKSLAKEKTVIIPNGIDFKKYNFKERKSGFNIAYVGYINYKKGPMLLLHTFKAIYDKDHRYKLYIAGSFQDHRDVLYYHQMIKEMGLEKNVFYEGWQNNVNKWLEDKNYIISTSVLEGHPFCIMEAMSKGIKPLIHNFVGAKGIYPGKYIWNTIPECVKMLFGNYYQSTEYRKFIEENYSMQHQIGGILTMLNNENHDGYTQSKSANFTSSESTIVTSSVQAKEVKEYYNKFVDLLKKDRERENPRHTYLKNRLAGIIKKGDKVLDLGCGIGLTSEHILSLGASRVVGVDLSEASINYAKETVKGVEFLVHDISVLNLQEKFDAIILCDCMEHVPDERYEALFEVIKNHIKEGGVVYLSIPDPEYLNFVRKHRPELLQIIDNSIFYHDIDTLCKSIEFKIAFFNSYSIFVGNEYNEYLLRTKKEYEKNWASLLKG